MTDTLTVTHAVREQLLRTNHLKTEWATADLKKSRRADHLLVHIRRGELIEDEDLVAMLRELQRYSWSSRQVLLIQGFSRDTGNERLRLLGFVPDNFRYTIWRFVPDSYERLPRAG